MICAKPTDWKTTPMPLKRVHISLDKTFSKEEIEYLKIGFIPKDMDHRWFMYWQDNSLYLHRSWVGVCIYVVNFTLKDDVYKATNIIVNRDPLEYSLIDDDKDRSTTLKLIKMLIVNNKNLKL